MLDYSSVRNSAFLTSNDDLKNDGQRKVTFNDVAVVLNESDKIGPPNDTKDDYMNRRTMTRADPSYKRAQICITTKLAKTFSIHPFRTGNSVRQVQQPELGIRRSLGRGPNETKKAATKAKLPAAGLSEDRLLPKGNAYDKPELHTAPEVTERLLAINMECFDPVPAVQEKLDTSPDTKKAFSAASTRPLNIRFSKNVFTDVLPLKFDAEALLVASATERVAKMKAVAPAPRLRDPQPVLKEFLTNDLQPEFIAVPLPSLHFSTPRQHCVSSDLSAYSLYRHKRTWEGLS